MTSTADQLVWTLARQCRPTDVVIVGVGTPLAAAAALLARELLHPAMTVLVGTTVEPALHDVAAPMRDAGALARHACGFLRQHEVLEAIQRGAVDLQFVSPAQVDGTAAINASRVRSADGSWRRLPGSLALPDTTLVVGRLVVYRAEHSRRFLVPRVDFVSGAPGPARPPGVRGRGPVAIVTDRALITLDGPRPRLASVHGGAPVPDVVEACGFELDVPDPTPRTEPPPAEAVELLDRVIDPSRMRELEVKDGRAAALGRLLGAAR